MDSTRLHARKLARLSICGWWFDVQLLLNYAGHRYVHQCVSLWIPLVYCRRGSIRESGLTAV
jgi:hypothetical protein